MERTKKAGSDIIIFNEKWRCRRVSGGAIFSIPIASRSELCLHIPKTGNGKSRVLFCVFFFSKIKVEVHFHKKQYHRFVSHITLLGEADFSSAHGRTVRFAPGS